MKQNKINESGRSMVEMLGVLAVIGVLSVGGITGYRTAMEQHYQNKALHLLNMFALSAQEASNSNTITGYDGNNAHSTCFCKATSYFCDLYLGNNACSAFQSTNAVAYKVKEYDGVKFYIFNGGGYSKLTFNIVETTSRVCKNVIELAYHAYYDQLPETGSVFNGDFSRDEWKEAMANCDEQAKTRGANDVLVGVKLNYASPDQEDLFNCQKLYPNACAE